MDELPMRRPQYLSPSAIATYNANPDEFYLKYLTDHPPPRDPQSQAMAVGSSFDAHVKSFLHEHLFGKDHDPRFELSTLFEAQVEEPLRDWAWKNGRYVFEEYKNSGVLADLMLLLDSAVSSRFEFEIRGTKHGYREGVEGQFGEVILLGKPDVDFVTKDGTHVILDWKVNGYCSDTATSPAPYYMRMRSAGNTYHGRHPRCTPSKIGGIDVNTACGLEDIKKVWAHQLTIYGWLLGNAVGSEFITMIHQVVCKPTEGCLPSLRFCELTNRIGKEFQQQVFDNACDIWEKCNSDHFFRDRSREESDKHMRYLDSVAEMGSQPDDSIEKFFFDMARKPKRW